jgi:hypothetical protein
MTESEWITDEACSPSGYSTLTNVICGPYLVIVEGHTTHKS